jgi:hypothetical protein
MRLVLEIRIDDERIALMSDWIDRFKQGQAHAADRARDEATLRLHKADVIKAQMPAFWSHLKTCIATDCARLRQELPDKPQYHCTLDNQSDRSFRLINTIPPRVYLIVEYNADGQCIDINESRDFVQQTPERLKISTTSDEDILIMYGHEHITAPEQLAEHLCRRVAQIT